MPQTRNSGFPFRRPLVPAILTPSRAPSNSLFPSSRRSKKHIETIHLDFVSGLDRLAEWYHRLKDTRIAGIQLRKEHDSFQHEYLLVLLADGYMCRIDRRPDPKVPVDTIMRNGCDAVDTVLEVPSWEDLPLSHMVETRSYRNPSIDLSRILFICYSIRSDEKARRYTLQKFNCYFFAWTMLLLISHHTILLKDMQTSSASDNWSPDQIMVELHLIASKYSELLTKRHAGKFTKMSNEGPDKDLLRYTLVKLLIASIETAEEKFHGKAIDPWDDKRARSKFEYGLEQALLSDTAFRERIERVMQNSSLSQMDLLEILHVKPGALCPSFHEWIPRYFAAARRRSWRLWNSRYDAAREVERSRHVSDAVNPSFSRR
jgi:hypothetical protein